MAGRVRAALAGDHSGPLVAPLVMRHAARLEQVADAAMFGDADVAARALHAVQRLYGLDGIFASTVDSVAWALRETAAPGADPRRFTDQQRLGAPMVAADPDAVGGSPTTAVVAGLAERLRGLLRGAADVGIAIPTAEGLAASVGGGMTADDADLAIAAFLRVVGAVEPDVVLRVGTGERGAVATATCTFFGIPLVEAGEIVTEGVAAPLGVDFVTAGNEGEWLRTSTTELPPETDARAMAAAIAGIRDAQRREGRE